MCGIGGQIRYDAPSELARPLLSSMRRYLHHRGPDGFGEAYLTHAALLNTRLAMVDAELGEQPMFSSDGRYCLVYNGELYNHDELRTRLGGNWRTRSDTETVLRTFEQLSERCVEVLDGMFALFVWDNRKQRGFAARDRLGVKPFAYHFENGVFTFASEAKAIVRSASWAPRADIAAVMEYLVAPAFSGVSRSPFSGIQYLAPGHFLTIDRSGVQQRRYYGFRPAEGGADDEAPLIEELRGTLVAAVKASMRSDVPLGVFLSGGLDSTAIAALGKSHLKQSFTVTFEAQSTWGAQDSAIVISDDTPYARSAATEFQFEHHEVQFRRESVIDEICAAARVNDALPAWEQELSQRSLARAAREHVKGVLVGDAADETHYGYHFLLDAQATRSPAEVLARLGTVPILSDMLADPVVHFSREYEQLFGPFDSRESGVVATTRLIVERWLPRLLHNGDIHTMAFGLEARVPFAQSQLLELAAKIPWTLAMKNGVEKGLLREALTGVIPESIRCRKKSALPKDQGVTGAYQSAAGLVNRDPHPLVRSIVDLKALQPHLCSARLAEAQRAALFRVIALDAWAKAYEVRS